MKRRILNHNILSKHLSETCCENGVCVTFADDVDKANIVILKVDGYYNSLNIAERPAAVDCLIIRKCNGGGYGLTLVELKAISSSKGFDLKNIKDKFENTLFNFIKKEFANPLDIDYSDVKLLFVTQKELYARDLGLKMDTLINLRFNFNEKKIMINPKMPHPTIKNCYN